jgi:hypothetical protein
MVDVEAVIRAYLAGLAKISAVFGSRVYAGKNLPAGYDPSKGAAVLLAVRGGTMDYSSKVMEPSVQMRVYAETEAKAREASRKLFDGINDSKTRNVMYVRMEEGTMPILMTEPVTNWPYILVHYKFFVGNDE